MKPWHRVVFFGWLLTGLPLLVLTTATVGPAPVVLMTLGWGLMLLPLWTAPLARSNRGRLEPWYWILLIVWLPIGLPVLMLGVGFAGPAMAALMAAGWALVLLPIWLALWVRRRSPSDPNGYREGAP